MTQSLECVTIQGFSDDLIERGWALAREKVEECERMSRAQANQRRTLVSPREAPAPAHITTIADFIFLKRISGGAFARVFLARKKKTGDIYAIKVTPLSTINQKNALRRILSERDILMQLGSQFIVNFCMFVVSLTHRLFNSWDQKCVYGYGISAGRRSVLAASAGGKY
jgi:hypothetical protein